MGCCKCEEHGWLDPQDVVWKDPADGKGYCVFHAPVKDAEITAKAFNSLVMKRIFENYCSDDGSVCQLTGIVVPGVFKFPEYEHKIGVRVNLSNSVFAGAVSISKTATSGLDFRNVIFKDSFSASHARLISTSFKECKFCKTVKCISSEFIGVDFSSAQFIGFADFSMSTFGRVNDTNLSENERTNFSNASFQNRAKYSETNFIEYVDFSNIRTRKQKISINAVSEESIKKILFKSNDVEFISIKICSFKMFLSGRPSLMLYTFSRTVK